MTDPDDMIDYAGARREWPIIEEFRVERVGDKEYDRQKHTVQWPLMFDVRVLHHAVGSVVYILHRDQASGFPSGEPIDVVGAVIDVLPVDHPLRQALGIGWKDET